MVTHMEIQPLLAREDSILSDQRSTATIRGEGDRGLQPLPEPRRNRRRSGGLYRNGLKQRSHSAARQLAHRAGRARGPAIYASNPPSGVTSASAWTASSHRAHRPQGGAVGAHHPYQNHVEDMNIAEARAAGRALRGRHRRAQYRPAHFDAARRVRREGGAASGPHELPAPQSELGFTQENLVKFDELLKTQTASYW